MHDMAPCAVHVTKSTDLSLNDGPAIVGGSGSFAAVETEVRDRDLLPIL